jgi:hypothetical protein
VTNLEEVQPEFARFRAYIRNEWNRNLVLQHICTLTSTNSGRACPPPSTWSSLYLEKKISIEDLIYEYLVRDSVIIHLWPALLMVMDDNIENLSWTAQVATSFAFFLVINPLPEALLATDANN